ncbi:MAG: hypothetical protein IKR18_00850 [Bacteroidaceae bacterium]|nr:hypothetical protein [Bacteroidaceae bacterium]
MNKTSLSNCGTCELNKGADCASCKLAHIDRNRKNPNNVDDDDYSISEELTRKGGDRSILYLVIAAVGTLALVVAFTLLLKH